MAVPVHRILPLLLSIALGVSLPAAPVGAATIAPTDVSAAVGVDLGITQTIAPRPLPAGEAVTITLAATNSGSVGATGVVVRADLPAALPDVGFLAPRAAVCEERSGVLTCRIATLAPRETVRIVLSGTVPGDATAVTSSASISGVEPDANAANDSTTATVPVIASADLALAKTVAPAVARPGETVTYTLAASNAGPSTATEVRIEDALPAGLTIVSADPACTIADNAVSCRVVGLPAGEARSFAVRATLDPSTRGSVVNAAGVGSATGDPDAANDTASATLVVDDTHADLRLAKEVSSPTGRPGDVLTYTLTASNNGSAAAEDVVVSDALPGGLIHLSSDPGSPTCSEGDGTVRCALGTLAPGAERSVRVLVRVAALSAPAAHRHHQVVSREEAQLSLDAGETRALSLSCDPGGLATDASVRVDHVDQGTGTPADVTVRVLEPSSDSGYRAVVHNAASGRAQAKLYVVCLTRRTAAAEGHHHDLVASDPLTRSLELGPGRRDVVLACGSGQLPIAPQVELVEGRVRVAASRREGSDWRFTVESEADGVGARLGVRCLDTRTTTSEGHVHGLVVAESEQEPLVYAGEVGVLQVVCDEQSKGLVSQWALDDGLVGLGGEPQGRAWIPRLLNPTAAHRRAHVGLTCVEDRTSGPSVLRTIVNLATASTSTPDATESDHQATATVTVGTGAEYAARRIAPPRAPGSEPGDGGAPRAGGDPAGNGGAPRAGGDPAGDGGAPRAGGDPAGSGHAPRAGWGGTPVGGAVGAGPALARPWATARVSGRLLRVILRCPERRSCRGVAAVRGGGRARYRVAAGRRSTLTIRLPAEAAVRLARRSALAVRLSF